MLEDCLAAWHVAPIVERHWLIRTSIKTHSVANDAWKSIIENAFERVFGICLDASWTFRTKRLFVLLSCHIRWHSKVCISISISAKTTSPRDGLLLPLRRNACPFARPRTSLLYNTEVNLERRQRFWSWSSHAPHGGASVDFIWLIRLFGFCKTV